MNWRVVYTQQAQKDSKKIAQSHLKSKALKLISILNQDPFQPPPQFEKLIGDLDGAYSRRINIQYRLVYQVLEQDHVVKVLRMWTHYE